MKADRHFVTALARGLDVMRCFTAHRSKLGTSDIAHITGIPQPTVWRLCHTLVKLGYLVQSRDDGKLQVGAPVLSLGYAALAELDFVQVARPHMQEMADRFQAAVALAERHELSMIYLERCHGESILLMNLRVGSRIPIVNSGAGWAYLAALEGEERKALLDQLRTRAGDSWGTQLAHIERALLDFDEHGFVMNCGVQHPDISGAAVPVRFAGGRDTLTLSCTGRGSVLTRAALMTEVGPELVRLRRVLQGQPTARRA